MTVAVIGCGYWGKNLVRNFSELGVLSAVCDESEEARAFVQDKYPDIEYVSDYASVLANPEIAAVAIATPAKTHASIARAALKAGKDVFVEKPLVLDESEGVELVSLAEELGRVLMVGHLLWYHPAVLKLKEMIETGELGQILYLASHRLNFGKIRREENVLWSFAPHDISVILGLVGEMPKAISCDGSAYLNDEVADVTSTSLTFPSGIKAHLFTSWLHPFKEQKLVVVGSKKMAVFDDVEPENKLMLFEHSITWENNHPTARKADGTSMPFDKSEPLKNECIHFLDKIEDRGEPRTNGEEGLKVLRVLNGCQRSLESNREIALGGSLNESVFVHETSSVEDGVTIGDGTKVWRFCNLMGDSSIGENCSIGQNVSIGPNVGIGNNVKIQNNVSVFDGVTLEDDVFCGPSMVFTNVSNPRSAVSRREEFKKTLIRKGASLGANCTIVCGNTVGRHAFVAAGAVVTKDVPDFGLVVGVPAKRVGWIGEYGERLEQTDEAGQYRCPESGKLYREIDSEHLQPIDE